MVIPGRCRTRHDGASCSRGRGKPRGKFVSVRGRGLNLSRLGCSLERSHSSEYPPANLVVPLARLNRFLANRKPCSRVFGACQRTPRVDAISCPGLRPPIGVTSDYDVVREWPYSFLACRMHFYCCIFCLSKRSLGGVPPVDLNFSICLDADPSSAQPLVL